MTSSTLGAQDDSRLMEAIASSRDSNAFRALYDRHSSLVFALCMRVLRDRSDAEELLVDVFWELWERADRYDPSRGSPLTYLVMLTRSRAIDRRRARPKLQPATLESDEIGGPDSAPTPAGDALRGERREIVKGALAGLDPQQRQVIELAFYDGLSHSEIADKLQKPLGTVKTWIRQGLIRLRDILRNTDGEPPT